MYSKPSAPQSIGQVLDGSFRLFRASWGKVWVFALLGAVLGSLGDVYKVVSGGDPLATSGMQVLLAIVGALLSVAFYSAIYAREESIASGRAIGGEFSLVVRLVPRIILMAILTGLVVMAAAIPMGAFIAFGVSQKVPVWILVVGSLILSVLPIILLVQIIFANLLIVVEDRKAVESLSVSRQLVKGNWWRTLALLTVGGVIVAVGYALAIMLVGAASALFASQEAIVAMLLAIVLVVIFVGVIVTPYFIALMLAMYHDLKLRKEGGDLSARIDSLG